MPIAKPATESNANIPKAGTTATGALLDSVFWAREYNLLGAIVVHGAGAFVGACVRQGVVVGAAVVVVQGVVVGAGVVVDGAKQQS
jgi:hypothetical protein